MTKGSNTFRLSTAPGSGIGEDVTSEAKWRSRRRYNHTCRRRDVLARCVSSLLTHVLCHSTCRGFSLADCQGQYVIEPNFDGQGIDQAPEAKTAEERSS